MTCKVKVRDLVCKGVNNMGTYDNLDKKSKNIVDTGVLLGILSDLGSGLTFIMDDKGTKLFPK